MAKGTAQHDYPLIKDFYKDKVIFITGASGFIGKVLIEKLLRTCADLKEIYLLMRPKKGLSIQERLEKMLSIPLFNRLREERGTSWTKQLKVINGDVTQLNLGLSEEDKKTLVEKVHIFYHNAASVRFDDPLREAIVMNTRGTRESCLLALQMKRIEMFFHVSTTYCNLHKEVVEEVIYPPVANWEQMIRIAETYDPQELQIISPKLMGVFPNTYTFTKNLAEHVVNDLLNERVPTIICRPSIVISTFDDPFPGWIDNFNGPAGMLVGCGKGVLRVNWANENVRLDYVPVDYIVKGMIGVIHHRMTREDATSLLKLDVYNASADLKYAITMRQTIELGKSIVDDVPLKNPLWYPGGDITSSKTFYFVQILFLHLLPAILVDLLLRLTGNKPMLLRIQRKVYVANVALQYFINKEWAFCNEKSLKVRDALIDSDDVKNFYVDLDVDHVKYFRNAAIGAKEYLMKEDPNDLDKDRSRMFKMKVLHYITKTIFHIVAFYYFVYFMFYAVTSMKSRFVNYYDRLDVVRIS